MKSLLGLKVAALSVVKVDGAVCAQQRKTPTSEVGVQFPQQRGRSLL